MLPPSALHLHQQYSALPVSRGPIAGFAESFSASAEQLMAADRTWFLEFNRRRAAVEQGEIYERITGENFDAAFSRFWQEKQRFGGRHLPEDERLELRDPAAGRVRFLQEWLAENPEHAGEFNFDLDARAQEIAREAETTFEETMGRAGASGVAGAFAGQIVYSFSDPIIALAAGGGLFGLGAAMTGRTTLMALVRGAAIEGAISGGTEAIAQPFIQYDRAEVGLDHGLERALTQVGISALAGGLLFGAFAGLRAAVRGARGLDADPAVRMEAETALLRAEQQLDSPERVSRDLRELHYYQMATDMQMQRLARDLPLDARLMEVSPLRMRADYFDDSAGRTVARLWDGDDAIPDVLRDAQRAAADELRALYRAEAAAARRGLDPEDTLDQTITRLEDAQARLGRIDDTIAALEARRLPSDLSELRDLADPTLLAKTSGLDPGVESAIVDILRRQADPVPELHTRRAAVAEDLDATSGPVRAALAEQERRYSDLQLQHEAEIGQPYRTTDQELSSPFPAMEASPFRAQMARDAEAAHVRLMDEALPARLQEEADGRMVAVRDAAARGDAIEMTNPETGRIEEVSVQKLLNDLDEDRAFLDAFEACRRA